MYKNLWGYDFQLWKIFTISPGVSRKKRHVPDGCMGSYEKVRQRGTPDSTAPPVFQETFSRKKSGFPRYLLPYEKRFWKRVVKLLDFFKTY